MRPNPHRELGNTPTNQVYQPVFFTPAAMTWQSPYSAPIHTIINSEKIFEQKLEEELWKELGKEGGGRQKRGNTRGGVMHECIPKIAILAVMSGAPQVKVGSVTYTLQTCSP
jgi:hypothetical protein